MPPIRPPPEVLVLVDVEVRPVLSVLLLVEQPVVNSAAAQRRTRAERIFMSPVWLNETSCATLPRGTLPST